MSSDASILAGKGNGTFSHPRNYTVGGTPRFITSSDFDRDGRSDLAVAGLRLDILINISGNAGD